MGINSRDENGNTLLHLACINGEIEIVKAILKMQNIDLNIKNNRKETALFYLCYNYSDDHLINELNFTSNYNICEIKFKDSKQPTESYIIPLEDVLLYKTQYMLRIRGSIGCPKLLNKWYLIIVLLLTHPNIEFIHIFDYIKSMYKMYPYPYIRLYHLLLKKYTKKQLNAFISVTKNILYTDLHSKIKSFMLI